MLRKKRIEMASRLLLDESYGVLGFAERCGYFVTASFTQAFAEETGKSLRQFRLDSRIS
ncbi:hypothetical protein [Ruegeria sp. ANG-R]|uniref:hypothetical protein n=1 Tax=Ruegeria sp. ANG-R TaxID=1577903 RepID=UPI0031BA1140